MVKTDVDPRGVFAILGIAAAVIYTKFSYMNITVTNESFIIGALVLTFVMAITTKDK